MRDYYTVLPPARPVFSFIVAVELQVWLGYRLGSDAQSQIYIYRSRATEPRAKNQAEPTKVQQR